MCIFVSINRFYYRVSTLSQSERLKKLNAELEMISKYDALTEIRNRYSLRGDFNAYIGKRIFLMMSDIDNFKNFNDQRGHDIATDPMHFFSPGLFPRKRRSSPAL